VNLQRGQLTIDILQRLLSYDPETGVLTWKVSSARRVSAGDIAGGFDKSTGYMRVKVKGVLYRSHRIAWALHHGAIPDFDIDHKNRKRTDNRIDNLRPCCDKLNMENRGTPVNNTTGFKGVYWHKELSKWHASIRHNKKQIHLGFFVLKADAIAARVSAEARLFKFSPLHQEHIA
jgi:hypothetical protein